MIEMYKRKKVWPAFIAGMIIGFFISLPIVKDPNENAVIAVLNAHADGVTYGVYASQDDKEKVLALAAAKAWKDMAKDKEAVKEILKNAPRRDEPFHLAVTIEALRILSERNPQQ